MTYYILLDMDTIDDIWVENILGEDPLERFIQVMVSKHLKI